MSTSLVEKEIERFLASADPEVLCLRGKWGVGKTYSWENILRRARDRNAIALSTYSYVSLFGRDSLAQLKYAIFENGVALQDIGEVPTVETFKSNTAALFDRMGQRSVALLQNLPQASGYNAEVQTLSFLSVRERLICVDDLERMGRNLPMKDVLGLISDLRDQKRCKIVLILNDDALEGTDRADFDLYNEKVIDRSLLFAPGAGDSVRAAILGDEPIQQYLRDALVALGIANIRIIKKVERLVQHVTPWLTEFDARLLRQAVQSLTLLGWCANAKDAPSLEFLREQRAKHVFGLGNAQDADDATKGWNALLDGFGFAALDEFDLALLTGIERGYFDEPALVALAAKRQEKIKAAEAEGSFDAAWRLYRDSFDNNEAAVVREICAAIRKNVAFVTPLNLNAAVRLLKDLGRPEKAAEMIRYYFSKHKGRQASFDLSAYPFATDVTDPDVQVAFEAKFHSFPDARKPGEILLGIARSKSCSPRDVAVLSKLSASDFHALFKSQKTADRARIIHTAIQLERFTGGEEAKGVAATAREALKRIGAESPLNRRRVLQLLDRNAFEG